MLRTTAHCSPADRTGERLLPEKLLPMNTGAEGVETAIKISRKWGYLKKNVQNNYAKIVVCNNNFHGRTTTVISFSCDSPYIPIAATPRNNCARMMIQ